MPYVVSPQDEPTPAYDLSGAPAKALRGDGASLGRRLNTLAEGAFAAFVRRRSDKLSIATARAAEVISSTGFRARRLSQAPPAQATATTRGMNPSSSSRSKSSV